VPGEGAAEGGLDAEVEAAVAGAQAPDERADPHRRPVHGEEQAEAYGARNGVPGELLIRVRIERVIGEGQLTD
jgi:hypothetical protein